MFGKIDNRSLAICMVIAMAVKLEWIDLRTLFTLIAGV